MLRSLARGPFNLNAAGLDWVQQTLASLSRNEKVAQLFNLLSFTA